jgi:hypothetical protein
MELDLNQKYIQKIRFFGKPNNRMSTMMIGEEDGNGFIYSQHTRLNIYHQNPDGKINIWV